MRHRVQASLLVALEVERGEQLDEFVDPGGRLVVSGERRWTDELGRTPLELAHSEAFPTGVLHLVYRPARGA